MTGGVNSKAFVGVRVFESESRVDCIVKVVLKEVIQVLFGVFETSLVEIGQVEFEFEGFGFEVWEARIDGFTFDDAGAGEVFVNALIGEAKGRFREMERTVRDAIVVKVSQIGDGSSDVSEEDSHAGILNGGSDFSDGNFDGLISE